MCSWAFLSVPDTETDSVQPKPSPTKTGVLTEFMKDLNITFYPLSCPVRAQSCTDLNSH